MPKKEPQTPYEFFCEEARGLMEELRATPAEISEMLKLAETYAQSEVDRVILDFEFNDAEITALLREDIARELKEGLVLLSTKPEEARALIERALGAYVFGLGTPHVEIISKDQEVKST